MENVNLKYVSGVFLTLFSIVIFISMTSFFFSWTVDQSSVSNLFDDSTVIENIGKKFGLIISYHLVYKGFGLGALFIPILIFIIGISLSFDRGINKILDRSIFLLLNVFWFSLLASYIFENKIYSGITGYFIKLKITGKLLCVLYAI